MNDYILDRNKNELERMKETSQDTYSYLKKIEKKMMKKEGLKTLNNKVIFKNFINDNHSQDEINIMINDLELNGQTGAEFVKTLASSVLPLLVALFGFMTTAFIGIFAADVQMTLKAIELKEEYKMMDYTQLIKKINYSWLAVYLVILGFIIFRQKTPSSIV
ncbi:hypothetical protein ABER98_21310 [Domibacillus aminovorans]|uniref:hypothetical protein n=1 Tax=Domibacillus aminovorans TaxID=29332 RepID=UPI003D2529D0